MRGLTVQSLPVVHLLGEGVGGAVVVHLDEVWEEVVDCLCEENWGEAGHGGEVEEEKQRREETEERCRKSRSDPKSGGSEGERGEERRVKARRAKHQHTECGD